MAKVRVIIDVPDSWTDDECSAFAVSAKKDIQVFAAKVEENRKKFNDVRSIN